MLRARCRVSVVAFAPINIMTQFVLHTCYGLTLGMVPSEQTPALFLHDLGAAYSNFDTHVCPPALVSAPSALPLIRRKAVFRWLR